MDLICEFLHLLYLGALFLSRIGLVAKNPGPALSHGSLEEFQSEKGLKVLFQNANHLWSKRIDFQLLAKDTKSPLVLGVGETWLNDDHRKDLLDIPGMKQYRYDRVGSNLSLGMTIYVSKELKHSTPTVTKGRNFTVAYTDVTYQHEIFRTIFVYRRPVVTNAHRFVEEYDLLLNNICDTNAQIVALGDFNFNVGRFPMDANARRILDVHEGHGLTQVIDKPTHYQGLSETIIDHVYVGLDNLGHDVMITNEMCQLNVGDHNMVGLNFLSRRDYRAIGHKHTFKTVLDYKKCDYERMKHFLAAPGCWRQVYDCNDLDGKWELFDTKLTFMLSLCCPTKNVRTCCDYQNNGRGNQWYTQELKQEKVILGHIHTYCREIMKFPPEHPMWQTLKDRRRDYFKLVRKSHREYDLNCYERCTTEKQKQRVVGRIQGKTKSRDKIDKIHSDGRDYTDPIDVGNIFNKFFAQVGVEAANSAEPELPETMVFPNAPRFSFVPPGFYKTYLYLNSIDTNKPAGPGGTPGLVYKTLAPCLMFVLEHIFSHCIYRSQVPRAWKFAHVSPIYKEKGLHTDPGNYRPIAVTNVLSKIFEQIMYDQLVEHLESNNCLSNRQYGYRRKRSTAYAVVDIVEKVRKLHDVNGQRFVGALMLDLSKAFDCVAHNLLLKMLPKFGLCENSTRLVASYLTDRKQSVKIGMLLSDEEDILSGVPQGSLLGPILFDLYVNSICDQIDAFVVQYADDTAVVRSAATIHELKRVLIVDLLTLSNFFKLLGLKLNVGKTEFLVFGCNGPGEHSLVLPDGTTITSSFEVRYLGVHIDSLLKFEKHNKIVLAILRKSVKAMRTIRNHITLEVAIGLLHATFYCYTDYCGHIWKQAPSTDISKKMEVQHRYFLRSVFKRGVTTHSAELYLRSGFITLELRRQMLVAKLVHTILEGRCPDNWVNFFRVSYAGERTRRVDRETVVRYNPSQLILNSLQRSGAQLWNSLRVDIRTERSAYSFKGKIWRFFRNRMRQIYDDDYPSDAEDYV